MTAPRRRLSFSLRTLFVVVAVLACWLGYCLNWKRARDKFASSAQSRSILMFVKENKETPPPWALRPFGACGFAWIKVSNSPSKAKLAEEARRLFPEAHLEVDDSPATQVDDP